MLLDGGCVRPQIINKFEKIEIIFSHYNGITQAIRTGEKIQTSQICEFKPHSPRQKERGREKKINSKEITK